MVTKYLQQAMDDIAVTKYMETVISKFLEADGDGDKFGWEANADLDVGQ